VEDLLKNIVVELCKATPDNVLEFIMEYISKQIALDGASSTAEALSTDITGEALVCHLESKDKPFAIDITDCISNQVDLDDEPTDDETVVITSKGARCSKTGDPIGAQRTTTCTEYDDLDEQLARQMAIHGQNWSIDDHFSLDGKQCGEECPCCRAESYINGNDMDGWIGACVQCLPPSTLPKCQGCLEDQSNQMAHIGPNGCLGEELY
jgi:hypothetical protein